MKSVAWDVASVSIDEVRLVDSWVVVWVRVVENSACPESMVC